MCWQTFFAVSVCARMHILLAQSYINGRRLFETTYYISHNMIANP
jgi:hypothetical protein